jgi:hypothetical protein
MRISLTTANQVDDALPRAMTRPLRKTDSNSRSLREGKGYWQPLQASIAVSDLNL